MSITTLDGAIAGARPPETILKVGATMEAIGLPHSHFYTPGTPGAAVAPSPGINGAALTSYAGQIPFTNPVSGNTHLLRLCLTGSLGCTALLLDRLWHNSGLSLTSTSLQSITFPGLPSNRDKNGASLGHGILCGLEFSAAGGAGTPTVTLTYTDQDGNTGITTTFVGVASPNAGTFFRFPLAAGDTGIRAVTGFQLSATWTSGTAHLVLYRVMETMGLPSANVAQAIDPVTSGFHRYHNDSVPFLVAIPTAVTAHTLSGELTVTQG